MSRDKQIGEMAKLLHLNYDMPYEFSRGLAEFLIDEGYAKASEVARDVIADMRKMINGYENIDVYLDRIEKKFTEGYYNAEK